MDGPAWVEPVFIECIQRRILLFPPPTRSWSGFADLIARDKQRAADDDGTTDEGPGVYRLTEQQVPDQASIDQPDILERPDSIRFAD